MKLLNGSHQAKLMATCKKVGFPLKLVDWNLPF